MGESYTVFYDCTDAQNKETPKCPNLALLIPESTAHTSKVNVWCPIQYSGHFSPIMDPKA